MLTKGFKKRKCALLLSPIVLAISTLILVLITLTVHNFSAITYMIFAIISCISFVALSIVNLVIYVVNFKK